MGIASTPIAANASTNATTRLIADRVAASQMDSGQFIAQRNSIQLPWSHGNTT
jgi:hypothetical protein